MNAGVSNVPRVITPSRVYLWVCFQMHECWKLLLQLADSFCKVDICDSISCPSTYDTQPTSFSRTHFFSTAVSYCSMLWEWCWIYYYVSLVPPSSYESTIRILFSFCLEKMFPPTESIVNMHPGRSSSKRLNVRGAIYANGTAAQMWVWDYACLTTKRWLTFFKLRLQRDICSAMDLGQEWANTNLELAGTKFCLDAGQSAYRSHFVTDICSNDFHRILPAEHA